MNVWVVKLGGSLARSTELPGWLDVVAAAGAGKIVLVPGGGPWADEVREAQRREGFDDRVAHRKALEAMGRYGSILAGMRPGHIVPAADVDAIGNAINAGRVPVWIPYDMVVADSSMPENWDVTSDSLSAWLAHRLGATLLVLVKSIISPDPELGSREMMRRGWVDGCFDRFVANGSFRWRILGRNDHSRLSRMLAADPPDPPIGSVESGGQ
jgi:aspartokinase-like uncharacterized kinase